MTTRQRIDIKHKVHHLAQICYLQIEKNGSKKKPAYVLTKTDKTQIPLNRSKMPVRVSKIVAGTAKPIGNENIGHRMLQKMGWASGSAIGKPGRKGPLEPLKAILKHDRKGIGRF